MALIQNANLLMVSVEKSIFLNLLSCNLFFKGKHLKIYLGLNKVCHVKPKLCISPLLGINEQSLFYKGLSVTGSL